LAGLLALGYAAVSVCTYDFTKTLARVPRVPQNLAGVSLVAPATFLHEDATTLADPGLVTRFELEVKDHPGQISEISEVVAMATAAELHGGARQMGFERAQPTKQKLFRLEAPWITDELVVTVKVSDGEHRFRAVVFARPLSTAKFSVGKVLVGNLYAPELLVPYLNPVLSAILSSIH
jgi:hypothetical protein